MATKYLFVYILKCSDGIYYTGLTNNPEKRLIEHNTGINPESYTFSRGPVEMIYCERFSDFNLAVSWEKRIKNWSRKKKEALINNNFEKLKEYAECKNETSHKHFSTSLETPLTSLETPLTPIEAASSTLERPSNTSGVLTSTTSEVIKEKKKCRDNVPSAPSHNVCSSEVENHTESNTSEGSSEVENRAEEVENRAEEVENRAEEVENRTEEVENRKINPDHEY